MTNTEKARILIQSTKKPQIDAILARLGDTHEEYHSKYPDTPVTPGLALDVLEAKEDQGLTNREIQKRWNLNPSQLNYALYNDAAIMQASNLDVVKARVLQDLKKTNKTQTEIADEHGISQSTVHKLAKEAGLLGDRKKRRSLTKTDLIAIQDAIALGESVESLAKQYDVSRDTIYKRLRDAK